jgi:hypothetical protein
VTGTVLGHDGCWTPFLALEDTNHGLTQSLEPKISAPSQQEGKQPGQMQNVTPERNDMVRSRVLKRRSEDTDTQRNEDDEDPEDTWKLRENDDELKIASGEFAGTVLLLDEHGWQQKICVSYSIAFRSLYGIGNQSDGRIVSGMEIDGLQVRVPQSTFNGETRPPQLRIRRTKIRLEPSIKGLTGDNQPDYRQQWYTLDQYPSWQSYQLPGSYGRENSLVGKFHFAANPSVDIEVGRKCSSMADPSGHSDDRP